MLKRLFYTIGIMALVTNTFSVASEQAPKQTFNSVALQAYTKIKTGATYVLTAAKKHPFITVGIAIVLLSKQTQKAIKQLPKNIWVDIQDHPVAMALLGGFLISYILG